MKLIRLFGIIVLICLIWGLGSAYDGKDYKPIDEVVKESSSVEQNISFSASEEESVIDEESTEIVDKVYEEQNNSDVSTKVVDKAFTSSNINTSVDSSTIKQKDEHINVPNSENNEQKTEVKDTNKETEVEVVIPNITESEVIKETPNIIEETKEEVDNELERLKAQVEYSTYDKCMEDGFSIALTDTVNILGFSCPYIVYKGQILGYRLKLDYTNPMEN